MTLEIKQLLDQSGWQYVIRSEDRITVALEAQEGSRPATVELTDSGIRLAVEVAS
jgi:hypothetical protein